MWTVTAGCIVRFRFLMHGDDLLQVEAALRALALETCKDVRIGDPLNRGISGARPNPDHAPRYASPEQTLNSIGMVDVGLGGAVPSGSDFSPTLHCWHGAAPRTVQLSSGFGLQK